MRNGFPVGSKAVCPESGLQSNLVSVHVHGLCPNCPMSISFWGYFKRETRSPDKMPCSLYKKRKKKSQTTDAVLFTILSVCLFVCCVPGSQKARGRFRRQLPQACPTPPNFNLAASLSQSCLRAPALHAMPSSHFQSLQFLKQLIMKTWVINHLLNPTGDRTLLHGGGTRNHTQEL